MKKVIYFFLSLGMIVCYACEDDLDPETGEGSLSQDQVIYDYNNAKQTLNALYTYLPNGFFEIGDALQASASDEAEFTIQSAAVQKFNNGSWNAVSNPDEAWSNNYRGIYNVNLFLRNVDSIQWGSSLEKDTTAAGIEKMQANLEEVNRWKHEARVLRAFFYTELVKRYGGVPIITEEDNLTLTSDFSGIRRNTLTECVDFIVETCDSAANVLPVNYVVESSNPDLGRVTKGVALALKSRILLYAASKLWNSPDEWAPGYPNSEYISMTDDKTREERWLDAARAAYAVISLDEYALDNDYSNLFGQNNYTSREVIFASRYGSDNWYEKVNYPIGFNGGNSGNTPLGNLVDQYKYIDRATNRAEHFSWELYGDDPYSSRDARMDASIIVNNSEFNGGLEEPRTVELWEGGRAGKGVSNASRTGYYIKKYVNPNLDLLKDQKSTHSWILIRYAEILLNYAEAINEVYGPRGKLDEAGGEHTCQMILRQIRSRVGIPMIRDTEADVVAPLIQQERQVELAFEGHRLWDVRRWMIAGETLGVPAMGVQITKNEDDTFTYKPVEIENRKWENKMYFYPIPQTDLQIGGWVQNPLW